MACEVKVDNIMPFLSLKGEKEKEQFRKKFGANSREVAAELRTLGEFPRPIVCCSILLLTTITADALEENLEFQRLLGGLPLIDNTQGTQSYQHRTYKNFVVT